MVGRRAVFGSQTHLLWVSATALAAVQKQVLSFLTLRLSFIWCMRAKSRILSRFSRV